MSKKGNSDFGDNNGNKTFGIITQYVQLQQAPKANVTSISETTTLQITDSGTIFALNGGEGFTITLPAPSQGLYFKFIIDTTLNATVNIVTHSEASIIYGNVTTHGSMTYFNGISDVGIVGSSGCMKIGTFVELTCISENNWALNGVSYETGVVVNDS